MGFVGTTHVVDFGTTHIPSQKSFCTFLPVSVPVYVLLACVPFYTLRVADVSFFRLSISFDLSIAIDSAPATR